MKDSHMNTIGEKYILVGMNKNAHIINRSNGELHRELDLKNREMSTSLVFGKQLYIGTYVDTLFIFSSRDFSFIQLVRTHESLLSMCIISKLDSVIAIGEAGGFVDIIRPVTGEEVDRELDRIIKREREKREAKEFNEWFERYQNQLVGENKPTTKYIVQSYIRIKEAGYINKVIVTKSKKEIVIASEKGIFICKINNNSLEPPIKERYLQGQLVSQIYEFNPHQLIAAQFHS